MVEMSKAVGPWREAVRAETQRAAAGTGPFAGPVRVAITFALKRPKGHYRTGRNSHMLSDRAPRWPGSTPDLDKLCRAVLDGLTEGGAWKDDGQVVILAAQKTYAGASGPGAVIEIGEL